MILQAQLNKIVFALKLNKPFQASRNENISNLGPSSEGLQWPKYLKSRKWDSSSSLWKLSSALASTPQL